MMKAFCGRLAKKDLSEKFEFSPIASRFPDSVFVLIVCSFELMFYVPVKNNGHVGAVPPFYGTFTQH